jgi:tripartite-type tricarboxylate transporter receptor subunit TctC
MMTKWGPRLAALLLAVTAGAQAQGWPTKPVRIVVPVATGGIADYYARVIGRKLTDELGQPVIVENRAGGGGNIGADAVAKATPDGHTLLMGFIGSNAVNQFLFKSMPYDTMKDFVPIVMVSEAEGMLAVNPSVPINSVADLLAQARAKPGTLTYASGGIGTSSHLAGELFKSMAKVDLIHVPYKGNAPAVAGLIGGEVQMSFATLTTVVPHVRAGKLRGVAVIGGQRSEAAPELPTISESGVPGFEVNNWIGLFAPSGTPAEIVRRLNAEVTRIMQSPEVAGRMAQQGERFSPNTPEDFARFVRAEAAKWEKVIRDAGLKAE